MGAYVLVCGKVFDGLSDALTGPAEILVEDNRIARIERSVGRPPGARVIDLSGRNLGGRALRFHATVAFGTAQCDPTSVRPFTDVDLPLPCTRL